MTHERLSSTWLPSRRIQIVKNTMAWTLYLASVVYTDIRRSCLPHRAYVRRLWGIRNPCGFTFVDQQAHLVCTQSSPCIADFAHTNHRGSHLLHDRYYCAMQWCQVLHGSFLGIVSRFFPVNVYEHDVHLGVVAVLCHIETDIRHCRVSHANKMSTRLSRPTLDLEYTLEPIGFLHSRYVMPRHMTLCNMWITRHPLPELPEQWHGQFTRYSRIPEQWNGQLPPLLSDTPEQWKGT